MDCLSRAKIFQAEMFHRLLSTIRKPLKNEKIPHKIVQLIGEKGENQGQVPLEQALSTINKKTHDIVLVAANKDLPVCRVISKKIAFESSKKSVKKAPQLKELEINTNIAIGDFNTKLKMAAGFLTKGNNIQFTLKKNGGMIDELLDKIINGLRDLGTVQGTPKAMGRTLTFTVKTKNAKS